MSTTYTYDYRIEYSERGVAIFLTENKGKIEVISICRKDAQETWVIFYKNI